MSDKIIAPHGGYRDLAAYQMAEIAFDGTVAFTGLYVPAKSRTCDQMVQAARSGKQNIAEGCMRSGTSRATELRLLDVARSSQEELLLDYEDYLRVNGLAWWGRDHEKAVFIRKLCYRPNRSYTTYKTYIEEKGGENAANTMICVVRQTSYLLDKLLRQLEKQFTEEGGFTERLHRVRYSARTRPEE
jgi:four helix bundle suffix protein